MRINAPLWFFAATLVMVFMAGRATAQTADVTASVTAIEFQCRAQAAPLGTAPNAASTGSMELYSDGVAVAGTCVSAGPDDIRTFGFQQPFDPANVDPEIRARAFTNTDCTGIESPSSQNRCTLGYVIAVPVLVP